MESAKAITLDNYRTGTKNLANDESENRTSALVQPLCIHGSYYFHGCLPSSFAFESTPCQSAQKRCSVTVRTMCLHASGHHRFRVLPAEYFEAFITRVQ